MGREYLQLEEMDLYNLSLNLSSFSWNIYQRLNQQDKIVMGGQFVRAIDSIGANIAEGYGRYHYLDRIKFYYNARGSLFESKYWSTILC